MKKSHILLKSKNYYHKINFHEVSHVTVDGDCSTLHVKNETLSVSASLIALECKLQEHFIRVNRNVVINISQISKISYSDRFVELSNGYKTEIAVRRIKEVKLRLSGKVLRLSGNS